MQHDIVHSAKHTKDRQFGLFRIEQLTPPIASDQLLPFPPRRGSLPGDFPATPDSELLGSRLSALSAQLDRCQALAVLTFLTFGFLWHVLIAKRSAYGPY
jgi:hypothetical protein